MQNHRRYVRSRDDLQLNGQLRETVSSDCEPFAKFNKSPIAPCGAIANSLFNGKFLSFCNYVSFSLLLSLEIHKLACSTSDRVRGCGIAQFGQTRTITHNPRKFAKSRTI